MSGIWKRVLKTYVNTFKGFNKDSSVDEIVKEQNVRAWETELLIDRANIHELIVTGLSSERSSEVLIEQGKEGGKECKEEEGVRPKTT